MELGRRVGLGKSTWRVALIALFGVIVFVSKVVIPSPIDKMTIVVQALFLILGSLLLRRLGATSVAAIGASLTILLRPHLPLLTIGFALIYGLLTDGFVSLFHVKAPEDDVRAKRLVAAVTLSTTITGFASYYTTVHVLALLPRNLILEAIILVAGVINGFLGGCLAVVIWRRALRHMVSAMNV